MDVQGSASVKLPSAVASPALGGLAELQKEREARDVKTQQLALAFDLFKMRLLHVDSFGEMLGWGKAGQGRASPRC